MFLINKIIFKHLYIFFLLFIFIFIKFSTISSLAENYTVKNINIKEKYNIKFNKEDVIKRGFEKAFLVLIYKIVENKDKSLFTSVSSNKIQSLVDNFSITNEKFVNDNYEVDFQVKFDKKKILSFIRSKKVISSIPNKTDVLFIPILIDTKKNELNYFNTNYFYNNWNNVDKDFFLIKYNLPDENIENFRFFQKIKNNIENYDFLEITKKYNFENIFITIFYKTNNNLKIFSKINFSDSSFNFNIHQNNINFNDDSVLENIIFNLKNIYEDKWKLINKINTSLSIPIKISINNSDFYLSDKLENLLNQSDFVYEYEIEKISSNEIIYRVIYNSTPNKLYNTLKLNGIDLNSSNDTWKLNE